MPSLFRTGLDDGIHTRITHRVVSSDPEKKARKWE